MTLPIYNCIIDLDMDDQTGIYAISFVDYPANEIEFIKLNRQHHEYLNRDAQKQILTGVVLQPEQLIYRNSPQLGDYYIRFSAEEIEKVAHKMMRSGIALNSTTHQHATPLKDNYLVELWIVEDPQTDKSKALGFKNLPKGTLMCSYKVEDKEYWTSEIMTGNVRGFSLEGFFNQQISMSKLKSNHKKMNMNRKKKPALLNRIARFLLDIQDVQKADATASGEPFVVFVLADGKEAYIDADGYATLDDKQMPAGEHPLSNGAILVIDEQGQFMDTHEASEKKTNPEEAKAPEALRRGKLRKLSSIEPQTAEAVKAKIAEMQAVIDELTTMLEETQGQVEELRRKTPSTRPAAQKTSAISTKDMTSAERMAFALTQTLNRRK